MTNQTANVTWRAGDVPVSSRYDDPYYSLEDGLAETQHVFLGGNDLPARFSDGFQVAELGFGTGLNCLATVAAWEAAGVAGQLRFTSFEAYPLSTKDMAQALAPFDTASGAAEALLGQWQTGGGMFDLTTGVQLEVIVGDARDTLAPWRGRADAWYLDGFSPAKNPELWTPDLMVEVARHTAPRGSFATYTAAGDVRRALEAAGFVVERVPGYGRKRHMTRGILPS